MGALGSMGMVPRPLYAQFDAIPDPIPPTDDLRVKALAERAIDAARSAGATYADIQLRHSKNRILTSGGGTDFENMTVGVRALVNGYWGFASSPLWNRDVVVRLAQSATQQAATSARGKARPVELAPTAVVKDQHWTMPVQVDPFSVHPDEVRDYLDALGVYARRRANSARLAVNPRIAVAIFTVHQKALATTDGTFCTQRLYRTSGQFGFSLDHMEFMLQSLTPAGMGWELFRDQPLRAEIDACIEERLQDAKLPYKPVDVGRYDSVLDALSMARVVSPTLGVATELDRALGYEANASGTSYLKDPSGMLGTLKVGAPLLNITGDRTDPGAVATVQWDDEGVAPSPFPIVTNGVLSNYSATREGAGWLKDATTEPNAPLHSRGCATAGDDLLGSMYVPLPHAPNLTVAPGEERVDFEGLIRDVTRGLAWKEMRFDMDFQQLNGLGTGKVYEIRNGKRVALVRGAGLMFQAPELYKNLSRLGGMNSVQRFGMELTKGEPPQRAFHSVSSVPAMMKELTVFDVMRKA